MLDIYGRDVPEVRREDLPYGLDGGIAELQRFDARNARVGERQSVMICCSCHDMFLLLDIAFY